MTYRDDDDEQWPPQQYDPIARLHRRKGPQSAPPWEQPAPPQGYGQQPAQGQQWQPQRSDQEAWRQAPDPHQYARQSQPWEQQRFPQQPGQWAQPQYPQAQPWQQP